MKSASTDKKPIRDLDGNSEMLPLQPEPSVSWRHGGGTPVVAVHVMENPL